MNDTHWGNQRDLRLAAESLADAIDLRVKTANRIRSGMADPLTGENQPTEAEIRKHPLVQLVVSMEEQYRTLLQERYVQVVPDKIREWAAEQPILKSGELFPRIVGLTGNPRWAVPLKMEGTGKDRRAVPDGEPYPRSCVCACADCHAAKMMHDRELHCWAKENGCRGLRTFYQWCGIGDPDRVPRPGMSQEDLLAMGKRTTIRPLLRAFSNQLVISGGRSEMVKDSKYYKLFYDAREQMQGRRHTKECQNHKRPPLSPNGCGTSAHREWGEVGSAWRPGHINAHGHRMVQKEFLRDFWRVSEGTR